MCGEVPDEHLPVARFVAGEPEIRRTAAGFIGFGETKPGDRVLFAADTHYDHRVIDAAASALRECGARVDVVIVDVGPDRALEEPRIRVRAVTTYAPCSRAP